MRENRTYGSDGGGIGIQTGPSYLYPTGKDARATQQAFSYMFFDSEGLFCYPPLRK